MRHGIKQKFTILIFVLVLMAFVAQDLHSQQFHFDPNVDLAFRMYNKYKAILTRDDLLPLLPTVLTALKDDKFQSPNLSVEIFFNPPLLREHIPNVDNQFIVLLQQVPNIQEMFVDFEFRRLYGNAAAIDALLNLLAPHLKQVKIDSAFVNVSHYGTLRMTGSPLHIGDSVSVGTSHTLIFTVIDADGNPVPGLPLSFRLQPLNGTAASGTFNPSTAITNQNGSAHVQVTFGPEPGDLRLLIDVDTQQIVDLVEFELLLGDTDVDSMVVAGIGNKFARTNTTRTLVFTATDPNGKPVEGEELTFGFRSASGSAATATFDPATATTDQNGVARTQITFGSEPGGIYLTVQSGPAVEQVNITSSQMNLGSQVQGTFAGLQVGDSVDVGSTHTLVFTATDLRGRPVSGLPIAFTFGGIPLELEAMFDPAAATTDRRGQVRTQVTFGEEPGDFELIVSIDAQRVIVFSEPEFKLEATNIGNLKVQGMEKGFAEPGSSINLVLTATDARGRPVANEELVFGVGIAPDIRPTVVFEPVIAPNRATAVFKPAKVKTNQKGKAQTRVTFGPEPGRIRLTVKSGMIIHSIMLDLEPYGTLKLGGLQIGDAVRVNSTHKLVFTATNEMNKPVPWLPLRFDVMYLDGTEVGAMFAPMQVVTNKNGKARTSVTFGDAHGDIRVIAAVDREQIVDLLTPKITLDDPKVAKLTVEGIEQGFARVGTTRKLFITAKNKNGRPVSGVNLAFGFRSPPESEATVMFSEATVKTDKNGQAQTAVTFGENSGNLRFVVQPLDRVTIHSFSSDFNLSMLTGELTTESFTIGDTFKIDSTHNFVFTATKTNGDPVPWLPLKFSAVYVDGTESGMMFEPATTKTNKNGMVRTRIIFSGDPGDIRLIAEVDREQIVEFHEPEITLDGSSVAQLTLKGIEQGFAGVGTKRTLVFTATDDNDDPVVGVELTFGFESESGSKATATFSSLTAATNEQGKAQTNVTFGAKPGSIRFTVKPVDGVKIWHVSVYSGIPGILSYKMVPESFEIGDTFDTNSTHTVVYTVIDDDEPVPGLPLIFHAQSFDGKGATATFTPATATTDENGMVKTSVTFGSKSGEIELSAKVDEEQIVEIVEVDFTLDDSGIDKLVVRGTDADFELVGTTRTLFFTATDENGDPVVGAELVFGIKPHSSATAVFNPTKAITDENGQAQTDITFGEKSGLVLMTVKPTEFVEIRSFFHDIDRFLLGFGGLTSEDLQIDTPIRADTTHTFVFTATDKNGNPMPGVPLNFGAIPLDGNPTVTFTPTSDNIYGSVTTDQNGRAPIDITFGPEKGAIRLVAFLNRLQVVQIDGLFPTLRGYVATLAMEGIDFEGDPKYVMPNSTRTFVFTATDAEGEPVIGAELSFGFTSRHADDFESIDPTTATFSPAMGTTNTDGQVPVDITFGPNPGKGAITPEVLAMYGVNLKQDDFVFHGFISHEGSIQSLRFLNNRNLEVRVGDSLASDFLSAQVWDTLTQQLVNTRSISVEDEGFVFNPVKGFAVLGSHDFNPLRTNIYFYNPPNPPKTLVGHTSRVMTFAFRPDGKLLASGSRDQTIRLWDIPSGRLRLTLRRPAQVHALAFSPDGQTLATGGNPGGIDLWNAYTFEHKGALEAVTAQVEDLMYSRDGQTLYVSTGLGTGEAIHIWDMQTQEIKQVLTVKDATVRKLALSPDEHVLAGGAYSVGNTYGVGPHVLFWKREPLLTDRIESLRPHSIELAGPAVVGPARSYPFIVTVKNASGQPLPNVRVWFNTQKGELWTDDKGQATFKERFPSIGKHNVNVTVLDQVTKTELKKTFPDRVEVPTPYAIITEDLTPQRIGIEYRSSLLADEAYYAIYRNTFTVQDATGQGLEGFSVKVAIGKEDFFGITNNEGKTTPRVRPKSQGEFFVVVNVLDGNSEEILREVLPSRVIVYWKDELSCGTDVPTYVAPFDPIQPPIPQVAKTRIAEEGNVEVEYITYYSLVATEGSLSGGTLEYRNWKPEDTVVDPDNESLILTVKFLDGTEDQKRKVRETVVEWCRYGNLFFKFDDSGPSDIRVQFDGLRDGRKIGHEAITGPLDDNGRWTVNFNTTKTSPYWENSILHEFGHVLGLVHEQHHPDFRKYFKWIGELGTQEDKTSGATILAVEPSSLLQNVKTDYQFQSDTTFGETYPVGSEHPISFWFKNQESGDPISGTKVFLRSDPEGSVTFQPFELPPGRDVITNQYGRADVFVIVKKPGEVVIHASLGSPDQKSESCEVKWSETPPEWDKYKYVYPQLALGLYPNLFSDDCTERKKLYNTIHRNVLRVIPVDEVNPELKFDLDSVMIYGIPNNFIKVLPGTPPEIIQGLEDGGIPNRADLSESDKAFIATVYGSALPRAQVSGSIKIEGVDDELVSDDETGEKTINIERIVLSQTKAYNTAKVGELKWGDECRVEVYLSSKVVDMEKKHIAMAVTALFFEGGDDTSNDLEDLECKTFEVPLDGTSMEPVVVDLKNEKRFFSSKPETNTCNDVVITFNENGLHGDWWGWGDTAKVTLNLSAKLLDVTEIDVDADVLAAPSAASISTYSSASDVNADGQINLADLLLVGNYLGHPAPTTPPVDVNRDGTVTIADLVQVAQQLRQLTNLAAPARIVMQTGLTYDTVQGWIDNARAADDGSLAFRQGIANLELLLTLIVPEKTALLHNYPNPFNPETWIPYHLSKPADVTLTIYAIDGKVVRRLNLGHQAAGYYQNKSRAAHWDGRNNVGERVASGVYFYTITAGDFAATRKMLILK